MRPVCFALLVLTIAAVPAAYAADAEEFDKRELDSEFDIGKRSCTEFFTSSLRQSLLLMFGQFDLKVDTSQTKCWITCLLQKIGLMIQNKIVPKNPVASDRLTRSFMRSAHLEQAPPECRELANANKGNNCERGYVFMQCVWNNWRKNVIAPMPDTNLTMTI